MNILRHLYLNSACRAPDDVIAADPVVDPVDPALVADPAAAAPAPAADPIVADPAATPDPAPAPAPAHGNRGQTPWFQRTIAELRQEKREEKSAREAAEQRAADLAAIIERMQADPAAAATPKVAAPAAAPGTQDFATAVKMQAAKDRLYEDTLAVRSAGEGAFADFGESLGILNAIGATNDDFVADVLAVDKAGAHKIFDKLAKDQEKAASLVGMDSRRRIAELTRMADALKTPEPKPAAPEPKPAAISKAPAPAPRVSPLAPALEVDPTTPDGNDKMTDAQWEKWAKSQGVDGLLKRRA
jgi:hypothetical protein